MIQKITIISFHFCRGGGTEEYVLISQSDTKYLFHSTGAWRITHTHTHSHTHTHTHTHTHACTPHTPQTHTHTTDTDHTHTHTHTHTPQTHTHTHTEGVYSDTENYISQNNSWKVGRFGKYDGEMIRKIQIRTCKEEISGSGWGMCGDILTYSRL